MSRRNDIRFSMGDDATLGSWRTVRELSAMCRQLGEGGFEGITDIVPAAHTISNTASKWIDRGDPDDRLTADATRSSRIAMIVVLGLERFTSLPGCSAHVRRGYSVPDLRDRYVCTFLSDTAGWSLGEPSRGKGAGQPRTIQYQADRRSRCDMHVISWASPESAPQGLSANQIKPGLCLR